jgi:hypothetical protein
MKLQPKRPPGRPNRKALNFSANVRKTTIARHLLAPRIAGAEVISIESINADDGGEGGIRTHVTV